MSLSRRLTASVTTFLALASIVPQAQAIFLPPLLIDFPPTVLATSPMDTERLVYAPSVTDTNTVSAMFDSNVEFTASPADAITVKNLTTGTTVASSSISIHKNMLYFASNQFTHPDAVGNTYEAIIHAGKVRKASGGLAISTDHIWQFTIANQIHMVTPFPPIDIYENTAGISLSKERFSTPATINFLTSADQFATYRVRVVNKGEYTMDSIVVKDQLPAGFVYDSLTFGTGITVTGTSLLTFAIAGPLPPVSTKVFDYRVKIPSTVANGTYDNSAIAMADFTPSGLGASAYTIHTTSAAFLNDDTSEDITVNHTTLTLPTFPLPTLLPTISTSPTPTTTSTPSGSSGFSHPSSDPLTCLQLSGATPINFSDVPSSLLQAPYISFLTSTVYASDPTVRLSRGYSNGTFGVNNTLTRFELTKMALGANCMNYVSSPSPNSFFTDVPHDNSEVSLVIGKAYANGIVSGVGDRFYPDRPVSYGEMVKILVGAGVYFNHGSAVTTLSSTLSGITDESFRQFAEHATRMNLVDLGPSSTFPQNDQVQRRFMAQAVARYIAWLKNITLL